jgi:hypothetical protein
MKTIISTLFLLFFLLPFCQSQTEMPEWPAELEVRGQKVVIYQPQTENYDGSSINARAA